MARKPIIKPIGPLIYVNEVKGRTVHLGDGRKLAYGESAEVSEALYAVLTK